MRRTFNKTIIAGPRSSGLKPGGGHFPLKDKESIASIRPATNYVKLYGCQSRQRWRKGNVFLSMPWPCPTALQPYCTAFKWICLWDFVKTTPPDLWSVINTQKTVEICYNPTGDFCVDSLEIILMLGNIAEPITDKYHWIFIWSLNKLYIIAGIIWSR